MQEPRDHDGYSRFLFCPRAMSWFQLELFGYN